MYYNSLNQNASASTKKYTLNDYKIQTNKITMSYSKK